MCEVSGARSTFELTPSIDPSFRKSLTNLEKCGGSLVLLRRSCCKLLQHFQVISPVAMVVLPDASRKKMVRSMLHITLQTNFFGESRLCSRISAGLNFSKFDSCVSLPDQSDQRLVFEPLIFYELRFVLIVVEEIRIFLHLNVIIFRLNSLNNLKSVRVEG